MKFITRNPLASNPRQAKGAALFISLVFLFILTIIGLTGMQSSSLQEKMAGNMRDRNLAFQAAETALRAGEQSLMDINNNCLMPGSAFACSNGNDGLYNAASPGSDCPVTRGWPSDSQGSNPYSPEDERFWKDNTDVVSLTAGGFSNLADVPRYVMEEMSAGTGEGGSLEAGNAIKPNHNSKFYRVTARGVGVTDGALVILQSVVGCN